MTHAIRQAAARAANALSDMDPKKVGNPADQRTWFGNLFWMIDQVRENADTWPRDKTGRWVGFVVGVLRESGAMIEGPYDDDPRAVTKPVSDAHMTLLARYAEMSRAVKATDLESACTRAVNDVISESPFVCGLRIGNIQGILCARGITTADAERDISRPLLHKAYEEIGIRPPETTEAPTP